MLCPVRSQSDLALTYNDVGVLENVGCHAGLTAVATYLPPIGIQMHCAEAFRICKHDPRANIFEDFSRASVRAVRKLIVSAVLGTDMTHHFKKLAEFTATVAAEAEVAQELYISEGGDSGGACNSKLKLDDAQRLLAVTVCLHAADVSNPAKAPAVYKRWAYRVMDEFFLQVCSPLAMLYMHPPHREHTYGLNPAGRSRSGIWQRCQRFHGSIQPTTCEMSSWVHRLHCPPDV